MIIVICVKQLFIIVFINGMVFKGWGWCVLEFLFRGFVLQISLDLVILELYDVYCGVGMWVKVVVGIWLVFLFGFWVWVVVMVVSFVFGELMVFYDFFDGFGIVFGDQLVWLIVLEGVVL